jgi:acyl transferase domain-containing protein
VNEYYLWLQALISACLSTGDISAKAIKYVAVHGTGTPLGDPIEIGALGSALSCVAGQQNNLAIGSSKVY